jgi:hypothetical protein
MQDESTEAGLQDIFTRGFTTIREILKADIRFTCVWQLPQWILKKNAGAVFVSLNARRCFANMNFYVNGQSDGLPFVLYFKALLLEMYPISASSGKL